MVFMEDKTMGLSHPLPASDFVLKMMDFVLKMMDFVLTLMECLLKKINHLLFPRRRLLSHKPVMIRRGQVPAR